MKNKTKWAIGIASVVGAFGIPGTLLYIDNQMMQQQEKLRDEVTRFENPVIVVNQDETLIYQGTGKDRSRYLLPAGRYRYLHVIPDLDNSASPYVEVENWGNYKMSSEATLHIGRNQPLPMYESPGNGGQFDW